MKEIIKTPANHNGIVWPKSIQRTGIVNNNVFNISLIIIKMYQLKGWVELKAASKWKHWGIYFEKKLSYVKRN